MTRMDSLSRRPSRITVVIVSLVGLLMMGGCATRAKVSASNEIAIAKFAIRDARASGAETHALGVLQAAEGFVAEASESSGAEAERIAEKALVHAQLANTIAQRESARKQLLDAQKIDREAGALRERTTQAVEERLQ
jgi:hypothetical protein